MSYNRPRRVSFTQTSPGQDSFGQPLGIPPRATFGSTALHGIANFSAYSPFMTANNDTMSGSDSSSSGSLSPGFGFDGSKSDLSLRSQGQRPTTRQPSLRSGGGGSASGSPARSSTFALSGSTQTSGNGGTRAASGGSSSYTQPSRRRQDTSQPTSVPNTNAYLLRQAEQTGNYGPTSLPPRSYSGQSPFEPPRQTPPKVLQSQMDYLDDVTRRIDAVELETQNVVKQRGERAIQNATLPGLQPLQVPSFGSSRPSSPGSGSGSSSRSASQLTGGRKRRSSGTFSCNPGR